MASEITSTKRSTTREQTPKQVKVLQVASMPTDIAPAPRPPEEPIVAAPPEVRDPTPEVGRVPDHPPPIVVSVPRHNEFERVAARDAPRAMGDDGTTEAQPIRYFRVLRTSRLCLPGQMTELAAGSIISTLTHDMTEKGQVRAQGIPIEECGSPVIAPAPLTASGNMLLTTPITPGSYDPVNGHLPAAPVMGPGYETSEDADSAAARVIDSLGGAP